MPLVGYPIAYLLLTVFSLANVIDYAIENEESSLILLYFRVLTSPFRGAFIAVVYSLNSETRNQIANSVRHMCSKLTHCLEQTGRPRTESSKHREHLLASSPSPNVDIEVAVEESKLTYGSH